MTYEGDGRAAYDRSVRNNASDLADRVAAVAEEKRKEAQSCRREKLAALVILRIKMPLSEAGIKETLTMVHNSVDWFLERDLARDSAENGEDE